LPEFSPVLGGGSVATRLEGSLKRVSN